MFSKWAYAFYKSWNIAPNAPVDGDNVNNIKKVIKIGVKNRNYYIKIGAVQNLG